MPILSMFIFFSGGSPTFPGIYDEENSVSKDACRPSQRFKVTLKATEENM